MDFNPDLIKQFVLTVVRYVAPPLISWMTLKLGLTTDQATAVLVGAIMYAISFIWALANKVRAEAKVNTALDMPKDSSKADLKEVIAAGQGTSATAKK